MSYVAHLGLLIAIYAALAVSLALVVGHLGALSLAHAGFFGVGAYATAVLLATTDVPVAATPVAAVVTSVLLALGFAALTARLRADQFALATFALQVVIVSVLMNWTAVTAGPYGIADIGVTEWNSTREKALAILAMSVGSIVFIQLLARSPFGRTLHAIRQDELLVEATGRNPFAYRTIAIISSAGVAGLMGWCYALYFTYVSPGAFGLMESVLLLAMVVVFGAASGHGPLVGAVIVTLLPEAFRLFGMAPSVAANLRQILFGVALVYLSTTSSTIPSVASKRSHV